MTRWVAGTGADAVALVLVGDELLLGDVVDTNAAWLGRRLKDAGLRVVSATHVADDVPAQVEMLRRALLDAPSVIVTGGLGPTSDDVTREALARLGEVSLRRDPQIVAVLEEWYARHGATLPPTSIRMADLPEGATFIGNARGSAPGIRMNVGNGVLYAVPGVPHEMRAMVEEHVLPDLVDRAGVLPVIRSRTWRVVGLGESLVAARLSPLEADLVDRPEADVAYIASPGQVVVRLTLVNAPGSDPLRADAELAPYAARIERLLGDAVAGPGDAPLDVLVHRALAQRGETVAVAESFTGGLLGATLTSMAGSSNTFRGGVVAYATELKTDLLDVPRDHLARRGAVDSATAAAMAQGVRTRLRATYGLATTGVAGPSPQDGHPPGTVHLAVAGPQRSHVRSLRLPGDRDAVRAAGVVHALDLLRRLVSGLPLEPATE